MLEVFINTILYIREVYPAGIFRRRKMYNTVVYVSIYPALNEYLVKILTTVQLLKKAKKLHKVELIIYKTENKNQLPCTETILEKFVFEVEASPTPISTKVGSTSMLDDRWTHDKYLIEFEEEIRKSLIQFDQIAKNLDRLVNCENVNFRIKLETTEAGFVELTHKMNSKEDVIATYIIICTYDNLNGFF